MQAVTYSEARANFAAMLDKVNNDHAPVLITRQQGKPAVLMSLEDFSAWEETAYLLRSPDKKREAWEDLKKARAFLLGEIEA